MNTTLPMSNSKELLKKIESTYHSVNPLYPSKYAWLCNLHYDIIESINDVLIDVSDAFPNDGTRVFAVQDLSSLGKGTFLGDYFYRKEYGFVAEPYDEDGYGYITRWVSFSTINNAP